MKTFSTLGAVFALSFSLLTPAQAEVSEIRFANQFGFGHLALTVLKQQKLVEKHAAQANVPLTTRWFNTQGSGTYEALVSNTVDVISAGLPGVFNLWDKTKGRVKAVGPAGAVPMVLISRNPNVKTVKDFSDADRIALPTIKVSPQAIFLQQAAAKAFGPEQFDKLDRLAVSLSHPDATAAYISGGEVNAHFTLEPFLTKELKVPGTHVVLDSGESAGGPSTQVVLATTEKFRQENPKVYAVFFAAYKEALEIIRTQPQIAAQSYLDETGDKTSLQDMTQQLTQLSKYYDIVPRNTLELAQFMNDIGTLKTRPKLWTDFYLPEIQQYPGS